VRGRAPHYLHRAPARLPRPWKAGRRTRPTTPSGR
jgi:hypothetical protein